MNFFKIKCAVLFLTILGRYCPIAKDSTPISFTVAIEMALQKNTNVFTAEYGVNTSEFVLREAIGNFCQNFF